LGRWEGIEEYICVVESGSFTAAAEQLGVSKSYVSKQVSQLEDRLGVRLLQRTTRRLTLTESGNTFFAYCKDMADQFDRAESTLSEMQQRPRGTLRLALNSRYGTQYMAGAVAGFSRKYPEVSVEVNSTYQDVDLLEGNYDLTVRYDRLEDSTLIARRLGGHSLCLCAAPEYWEAHGKPGCAEDLEHHNCLTSQDRFWLFHSPDRRDINRVKVSGNWISEDGANLLMAAKAGIGIAQLPDFYVNDAVAAGDLEKLPASEWNSYHRMAWAVYPNTRHLSAKVRYFIDYLVEYIHGLQQTENVDNFQQRLGQ
jgi:DNA-binding transcriptional LysR family regulator